MDIKRKPFEGILNIVRFNWHFYVIAAVAIILIYITKFYQPDPYSTLLGITGFIALLTITTSLVISYYIYDGSRLYQMYWLPDLDYKSILIVNAGFDEISHLVQSKYPNSNLTVVDFYDPSKHTEVSIARARKAYPPFPGTRSISTDRITLQDQQFDIVIAMLSAHEIRLNRERTIFFNELNRVLKNDGEIFVTEHLRDLPNFLAYTVGFFHFHSEKTWRKNFLESGFTIQKIEKTTSFISTFILNKNGNTF